MTTKTDNHDPRAKLELRRYFLRKYHSGSEPIHVLDCCQGSEVLWRQLRREFAVASYWGVDIKASSGRLKIDSARILAQPGWPQNVVDVDTYGNPFRHFAAIVQNLFRPTTVFLTIGQIQVMGSPLTKEAREALGLKDLRIPNAIGAKLNKIAVSWLLTRGCDCIKIVEAVEALSNGHARYIGIRLEPIKANGQQVQTASRSEHPEPMKEVQHV